MWKRSRNGIRKLDRRLDRHCNRYAGRMCSGARRPRRPDYLAIACRLLNQSLRIAKRMAKEDPHIFGPRSREYFRDTLKLERQEQEMEAAVRKVYGPPVPGQPEHVSTLWTDRYLPEPKQRRLFLKWFRENYPST
jgi:hypothetical protein